MKPLYRFSRAICRLVLDLGGGVRAFGTEHIPKSGTFLICANHSTVLDPPAMGISFGRELGFLAKKELYSNPLFGGLIRNVNAIPVDRSRLGKDTIVAIKSLLESGIPVMVFPEGTRSRTGKMGEGKIGVGFLAREAGVPLLPAYLHNIRLWPRTWKRNNRMAVYFGPPIGPEWVAGVPAGKKGYREISDHIMERIRTLQQVAVEAGDRTGMKIGVARKVRPPAAEESTICPKGQI